MGGVGWAKTKPPRDTFQQALNDINTRLMASDVNTDALSQPSQASKRKWVNDILYKAPCQKEQDDVGTQPLLFDEEAVSSGHMDDMGRMDDNGLSMIASGDEYVRYRLIPNLDRISKRAPYDACLLRFMQVVLF